MLAARSIPLEPEAGVFMAAPWTRAQFRTGGGGIELVATDAMKGGLAPLPLEALVLAPVIVEPEGQKQDANQSAVYHGGSGKFEHGGDYKQKRAEVKLRRVRVESLPDR
jgi:hypothetical protein